MRPARLLPLLVALSGPAVAADLAQLRADLAVAVEACARHYTACPREDELKRQVRAAEAEQLAAEQQRRDAEAERLVVAARAEDARETERAQALKRKCAKVRMRIGAMWGPKLRECYGPFEAKGESEGGAVYEAAGGWVRVHGGKVVSWVRR